MMLYITCDIYIYIYQFYVIYIYIYVCMFYIYMYMLKDLDMLYVVKTIMIYRISRVYLDLDPTFAP